MAPLVDVIRMVDTEEKPFMAYIYSAIEDCKLKVKTNLRDQNEDNRELWKKIERILDRRWSGTDITYGVLEDAEDGFDDPPLTRTSRMNTASHCSQGGASSLRLTTRHLQDSSNDDDYDVDANYDVGDGDDDGIDSGSDEDI
ncbi:hypothetical protein GIB67_042155 [Kingdonia uniflora]|uniref:Uncharacterized protein n=1 Tax=Kingdonia uniflora TaxID=39325 RepID=A0A7J7NX44_9MAGN|nr:hypothetical protein GIB67_042155 [Kingdonia uniflora]